MITNASFTDPQGQTHASAVVCVLDARYNKYWNGSKEETYALDRSDVTKEVTPEVNEQSYDNEEITVTYCYWPSQNAMDSGLPPYTLLNVSGSSSTRFNIGKDVLEHADFLDLTLPEKCEKYFTDTILPTL